jgi:hypothetical protein
MVRAGQRGPLGWGGGWGLALARVMEMAEESVKGMQVGSWVGRLPGTC